MNLFRSLTRLTNSPTCASIRRFHLEWSPNYYVKKSIWNRYRKLKLPSCKTLLTYIWIDGTGEHVRSKIKTIDYVPSTYKDCPNWDHDGSSTYLTKGNPSDILLCPVALYNDPNFGPNNKLVLCETYDKDSKPTCTNHRNKCMEALNRVCDKEPMFGIEQEFMLMDVTGRPLGWPSFGEPTPQGPYYCGVGAGVAWGRDIVESHCRACLFAGVELSGANVEVAPAQWEFQTGPSLGIKAADDMWIARYLMWRIAEDFGVEISLHPKLFPHWNGSACHLNFSTKAMREDNGIKAMEEAIGLLEKTHIPDLTVYDPHNGEDNRLRLTGPPDASSCSKFTWGIGDRLASVRISKRNSDAKKGWIEDRRPSANADPYQIVNAVVRSAMLQGCQGNDAKKPQAEGDNKKK